MYFVLWWILTFSVSRAWPWPWMVVFGASGRLRWLHMLFSVMNWRARSGQVDRVIVTRLKQRYVKSQQVKLVKCSILKESIILKKTIICYGLLEKQSELFQSTKKQNKTVGQYKNADFAGKHHQCAWNFYPSIFFHLSGSRLRGFSYSKQRFTPEVIKRFLTIKLYILSLCTLKITFLQLQSWWFYFGGFARFK